MKRIEMGGQLVNVFSVNDDGISIFPVLLETEEDWSFSRDKFEKLIPELKYALAIQVEAEFIGHKVTWTL